MTVKELKKVIETLPETDLLISVNWKTSLLILDIQVKLFTFLEYLRGELCF